MYYSDQIIKIILRLGLRVALFLCLEIAINILIARCVLFLLLMSHLHIHVKVKPMVSTFNLSKRVVRRWSCWGLVAITSHFWTCGACWWTKSIQSAEVHWKCVFALKWPRIWSVSWSYFFLLLFLWRWRRSGWLGRTLQFFCLGWAIPSWTPWLFFIEKIIICGWIIGTSYRISLLIFKDSWRFFRRFAHWLGWWSEIRVKIKRRRWWFLNWLHIANISFGRSWWMLFGHWKEIVWKIEILIVDVVGCLSICLREQVSIRNVVWGVNILRSCCRSDLLLFFWGVVAVKEAIISFFLLRSFHLDFS